jgi:two-component system OmpR family response regulator
MRSGMKDNLRALIVDDEVDVCYLLSVILKHKNLESSYVNTISEAKRVLLENNPCIIFLDNHLPDGFGVNFIEEIKDLYPDVKIVMITAHDTTTDRDRAYKNGADQFIGKPFTRDVIFKTLESLLN